MKGSENKLTKGIGEVQGSSNGYRSFNVHLNRQATISEGR